MMTGFRGGGKEGFSSVGKDGIGETGVKRGWSAVPALQMPLLNECSGVSCKQAEA